MDVLLLSSSDSINSVSSLAKTSTMELADGQTAVSYCHKLRGNKSTVTQPSNGPLASFHEMVETHLDPTKELKRLISECKYDKAFTIELHRSDVAIVSRLCSQAFLILSSSVLVDLQGIMSLHPLLLGQGGSIALSATATGL
ncbi:ENHANCER OF MRNA-DECAPPING PROTEIN 4 [Salix koriyanagi]|uniref:ENHANCER OF MRNA-DECAPPING PROTEIN 4 n=1 Tax=Salix koriyanagi TaxID=2511006 RepID=A0A9Q0ZAY2_9ROSI|nr:ENHANCER OF MRNA-DECAPPING PROTEIN 4 [Salix koriyanagi]